VPSSGPCTIASCRCFSLISAAKEGPASGKGKNRPVWGKLSEAVKGRALDKVGRIVGLRWAISRTRAIVLMVFCFVHAKRERYRDRAGRVCIGLLTAGDRPPLGFGQGAGASSAWAGRELALTGPLTEQRRRVNVSPPESIAQTPPHPKQGKGFAT
jgi:hypothetical protein